MSRAPWSAPHNDLEGIEQRNIVKLYRAVGCKVYILSQPRQTKQSTGLPDLIVKHKGKGLSWTHECKRTTGRSKVSEKQQEFADLCLACGDMHLIGGQAVAEQHLVSLGILLKRSA